MGRVSIQGFSQISSSFPVILGKCFKKWMDGRKRCHGKIQNYILYTFMHRAACVDFFWQTNRYSIIFWSLCKRFTHHSKYIFDIKNRNDRQTSIVWLMWLSPSHNQYHTISNISFKQENQSSDLISVIYNLSFSNLSPIPTYLHFDTSNIVYRFQAN